jgi:hypothetical protein
MIRNREVQAAYLHNERADRVKEDIFVNITLYRVPCDLVREFTRNVVVNYSGGMSEALQDLMRKALKK